MGPANKAMNLTKSALPRMDAAFASYGQRSTD
jgi:hypothetical protein